MSERAKHCTTLTGAHRYEPVYDEVPMQAPELDLNKIKTWGDNPNEVAIAIRSLTIRNVYVQSVCRYCGDVIDRIDKEGFE